MLGIDLGTTNSLAALFEDGQTRLIPNALGHYLTPSAVSVAADGTVLVGLPARERLSTHPRDTAMAFKRWMGSDRVLKLGKQSFRPEELSALVLKSLKADVENHLGTAVHDAVITVPAYFNQTQRSATMTAARLAGLNVARLLNEPTAAGLAYGLQERADHSTFLVFDLGGGTFDVSVLEYFEGVVQVRSSAGDTQLGGEDFVRALQKLFLSRCNGLTDQDHDLLLDSGAFWRAAEQAKRDLGEQQHAVLQLQHRDRLLEQQIQREEFERACAELLQRLRKPIERALMDARLQPQELAEVVLVGGATRMPMVRQAVTQLFRRLPLRTINPDETIARGAAVQAALIARHAALEEVVLTDVMPYSLGVISHPDRFAPIIERNMPVPVSRMERFQTVQDQQTIVQLDIRQGESPIGSENLHLGELSLPVSPLPAGQATLQVRFSYDANGLLVVDARDDHNGHQVNCVIRQGGNELSEQQVAEALRRLERLKVHPREEQENRYLIERAKRMYADHLGETRQVLQHALLRFEAVLDAQDPQQINPARRDFRELLEQLDRGFTL